jgi:hypothetical protein
MTMWILLIGNAISGFQSVGPFQSQGQARDHAHGYSGEDRYESWCEMEVTAPVEDDDEEGE